MEVYVFLLCLIRMIIMYKISDITKRNLERSLGISLNDFTKLSADEERGGIKCKI